MTEEERQNWVTAREAAQLSGRGESTIRALAKAGKIGVWEMNPRMKLYKKDDILNLPKKDTRGRKQK
jgi:hypothetical protein